MKMEHLVFLDSVSYFPCLLRKLPEAYGLTASKSWYPHDFNTEENLDCMGPIPDVSYYGVNKMGEEERRFSRVVRRPPEIGGAFRQQARP